MSPTKRAQIAAKGSDQLNKNGAFGKTTGDRAVASPGREESKQRPTSSHFDSKRPFFSRRDNQAEKETDSYGSYGSDDDASYYSDDDADSEDDKLEYDD